MPVAATIYRLAVALWTGGVALFTLAVTPMLFKTFGRDHAGQIVGAVFPTYFRWGLACGVVALACAIIARGRMLTVTAALLLVMLSLTAFQAFYIEPRAAALKKDIPSFETTSKDHPLRREFAKLHGISAACNLAVLAGGVALIARF
ncbi:DUF4149 domain-containing protein [Geobacter sp. DSM 9736]|uniref:DUF4149 domain-containing protein n=1 Tax=Geobacter sp. DSM 9736 TaxID=1277350 RepID=UPI000B50CC2D|nr:DUF4149 domain-containing protein [Geobacter sp. DSM 9736]SNB46149.1 protein of unknown function [Geobacter sp. DSM 9736]